MRIGIGSPNTIPGTAGPLLTEWACLADAGPFASLGVFDRLLYDSHDALAVLAGAAGVTERVSLAATIVAAPLHRTVMLAKTALTIDALSNGRLVLGLGVGARTTDYDAAGVEHNGRGRRLSDQLIELRELFDDERIGPRTGSRAGPPLLIGGSGDEAFARMARHADGYVHGGGPPRAFARAADRARAAWGDFGRPDAPRLWAQGYYALGDRAEQDAGRRYLREYYSFTGPFAERIAAGLLTTPQEIVQFCSGYEESGCDDLILFPAVASIDQVDRLAQVVAGR